MVASFVSLLRNVPPLITTSPPLAQTAQHSAASVVIVPPLVASIVIVPAVVVSTSLGELQVWPLRSIVKALSAVLTMASPTSARRTIVSPDATFSTASARVAT